MRLCATVRQLLVDQDERADRFPANRLSGCTNRLLRGAEEGRREESPSRRFAICADGRLRVRRLKEWSVS